MEILSPFPESVENGWEFLFALFTVFLIVLTAAVSCHGNGGGGVRS